MLLYNQGVSCSVNIRMILFASLEDISGTLAENDLSTAIPYPENDAGLINIQLKSLTFFQRISDCIVKNNNL